MVEGLLFLLLVALFPSRAGEVSWYVLRVIFKANIVFKSNGINLN